MKVALRSWHVEALIALAVFLASAWWGTTYWNASWKSGREPQFYQLYFEPAVMVACHHGFVVTRPQPKPLEDFLWRRVNTFSCVQVAGRTDFSTKDVYQGAWRYLLYTVGMAWRYTGIAWSRMGPILGVLFGLTIVVSYGIFRLAMGRPLALAGAFALSVSTLHLTNMPHLRDYSKAPFTVGLVLILGLLVTRPVRRSTVLWLSAAYGAVLGIGYGFRTDLLVDILPIFGVLFLFFEGGVRGHLATKALGAAAFVLTFLVTAWPILSFVNQKGGAQWHVVLLGLSTPFDEPLQIVPAPYDLTEVYEDGYIAKTAIAYAARMHPQQPPVVFGTHDYDVATGGYLVEIVSRFPGDVLTRAYASAVKIMELPFGWPGPPLDGLATWIYRPRLAILGRLKGAGPLFVVAAIVLTAAYDLRIGLFLLAFLLYFGGYPALQFGVRHHFHLEFMGWWSAGILLQGLIRRPAAPFSLRRVGLLLGIAAVALVLPLILLRLYQGQQARRLFNDYEAAAKTPIALPAGQGSGTYLIQGPRASPDVRLMEIDLAEAACGNHAQVSLRYDTQQPNDDYSRTIDVGAASRSGETHIFAAVYPPAFQGIELTGAPSGCLLRASWIDPDHRPLLLDATLRPGWERSALYQRLWFEGHRR